MINDNPNRGSRSINRGRLGNQCFIHLAASIFAEKHNLYIEYENIRNIEDLGFDLFVGEKKYDKTVVVNDENYLEFYNKESIDFNVDFYDFFQSTEITNMSHLYLQSKMSTIISKNKYKDRYNNNNDCFVHVRLGDVEKYNPGFSYYDCVLSGLSVDNIYLTTDTKDHFIIKQIVDKYPNIEIIEYPLTDTILFGSTCKYIVLSYGTFSAMIGYLAFYSVVYHIQETLETRGSPFNPRFDIFNKKFTKIKDFIQVGKINDKFSIK